MGCYYLSENINNGYIMYQTKGIQISIKRFKADLLSGSKIFNVYFQYYDDSANNWVTVHNLKTKADWTFYEYECNLDKNVFTTAVRIYTDTIKTSGNNFSINNFQVYPK